MSIFLLKLYVWLGYYFWTRNGSEDVSILGIDFFRKYVGIVDLRDEILHIPSFFKP